MSLRDADFQTVLEKIFLIYYYKNQESSLYTINISNISIRRIIKVNTLIGLTVNLSGKDLPHIELFRAQVDHSGNWLPATFHRGIWLSKIEQAIAEHEAEHMSEIDDSAYFS